MTVIGSYLSNTQPFYNLNMGIQTEFGTLVPPASRCIFVRSTGPQSGDSAIVQQWPFERTLNAALAKCRSGLGDIVFVLPGHSESVTAGTALSNLKAGTKIIGLGSPSCTNAPTFRWTNTAGSWAVNVANVEIRGLRLRLEGANGITKAINITGASCVLADNDIQVASGASNKATIAIEVGSGATECKIVRNYFRGTATHNVTDGIKVVGATTPDDLWIVGNTFMASATAANGLIHLTVAAKNVNISNNWIYNTHTASTSCITCDAVAADGLVCDNYLGIVAASTIPGAAVGFVLGSFAGRGFNNQVNDTNTTTGAAYAAAAT